jgi:WhiB family transcriptional regulator, redox-sensing transcriptional regulator
MTNYAAEWRASSACLSADPELFFPIAQGSVADRHTTSALRVCAGCAVRQQCLEFAMQSGEAHGIWGGTTADERIRARRRSARRRRERRSCQQTPDARAS